MSTSASEYRNSKESESLETKRSILDNTEDQQKIIKQCLEHEMIKDNFEVKKKIGCGASGFVYQVVNRCDSTQYALKIVPIDHFNVAKREAEALASLKHDNIIRYHSSWVLRIQNSIEKKNSDNCFYGKENWDSSDESSFTSSGKTEEDGNDIHADEKDSSIVFQDDSSKTSACGSNVTKVEILVIQTELCVRNLQSLIEEEIFLMSDSKRLEICLDIIKGLKYIHSQGYIHRDLKPSNIFLHKNNRAMIGDFGFAIQSSKHEPTNSSFSAKSSLTGELGTVHYMAPEVRETTNYDKKADLYSLGIIMFEMYCKIETQMERNEIMKRLGSGESMPTEVEKIPNKYRDVREVVKSLLDPNPLLRMELNDVVDLLTNCELNTLFQPKDNFTVMFRNLHPRVFEIIM